MTSDPEMGLAEPDDVVRSFVRPTLAPRRMPVGLWRTERPLSVADADRIRAAYLEHGGPWQAVVEEFGLTRTDAPGVILLGADPTEGEAFRNA